MYTGITGNLKRRIKEHLLGEVLYTKNRRPFEVVYIERFENRKEAARREKEIKRWRHQKKEKLIERYLQREVASKRKSFKIS